MNQTSKSMLIILLLSISFLAAETVHFIDGSSTELKILQVKKNRVYLDGGGKLFIVSKNLLQNDLVDLSGKVNFNSYHEIVEISTQNELDQLSYFEIARPQETMLKNRNFLYLELSTILNGVNGGFFYEYFMHKSLGLSVGFYKGSAYNFGFLTVKESAITSFPIGVLLVPNINQQINLELGFSIEYVIMEKTEGLLLGDEASTIEEDRDFKNSLKLGLRYQPELEGISFKGGGKLFIDKGIENLGIYFDLGVRF
jgi:hypothetical protein